MGKFDRLALVTAALATASAATNGSKNAHAYYASQIEGAGLWMWITGWLAATYAPLALAVWCARQATRTRRPWKLHLLFLPAACLFYWGGFKAMLSVIDDPDFDATLSAPLMPAILLFLVAVVGYFAAAVVRRSSTRQTPPETGTFFNAMVGLAFFLSSASSGAAAPVTPGPIPDGARHAVDVLDDCLISSAERINASRQSWEDKYQAYLGSCSEERQAAADASAFPPGSAFAGAIAGRSGERPIARDRRTIARRRGCRSSYSRLRP